MIYLIRILGEGTELEDISDIVLVRPRFLNFPLKYLLFSIRKFSRKRRINRRDSFGIAFLLDKDVSRLIDRSFPPEFF